MGIPSGDSLPEALIIPRIVRTGADLLVEMVQVGRYTEIRAYDADTGRIIPLDLEKEGRYYQRIRFEDPDDACEAWELMFGCKAARKKWDRIYRDLSDWEFVDRRSANDEHPSVVRDRGVSVDGRARGDDPRTGNGSQRVAPPRGSRRMSRNSRASRRRRKHQRSCNEFVSFLALTASICAFTLLMAFAVWEVSLALIGNPHRAVGLSLGVVAAMWFGWRWLK